MKKMGRPKVPKSEAKRILVGAMLTPPEAKQIKTHVAQSKQSKSEWVRDRLLAPESQAPSADLRKFWFRARIRLLDGQTTSTGLIRLRTAPVQGTFVPDHPPSPSSDILRAQKLVAEIGKHQFELEGWEFCGAKLEDLHNLGPHFHFVCPLR
jgi:hypothetical protein